MKRKEKCSGRGFDSRHLHQEDFVWYLKASEIIRQTQTHTFGETTPQVS